MKKSITIEEINAIIDKETEFAREVNVQMACGMYQIKKLLNEFVEEDNE